MDIQEQLDKRRKSYNRMRSMLDFGMGLIYIAAGVFLFIHKHLGLQIDLISGPFAIGFGALLLLYGGWRIYRGFQQNY